MNRDIVRQFVNITALIGALVINFLSNTLPLNGQTAAQISNRLPILFVPENYVFSIWGIIYVLLIGFAVYQARPSKREDPAMRRIGYWFALSCVANGVWLLFFHYNQFPLSMVAMVVLLVSLIMIYLRLDIGRRAVRGAEKWWVHTTFSVYLGWITVATVANAAYVLFDAGWDGFGIAASVWTIIMLVIATLITLSMVVIRRDVAYTAVILWALVGIVIKQVATPPVAITAGIMVAAIGVVLVARLIYANRSHNQMPLKPARAA